ncbi:hypothetical protein JHK82_027479 [Glycine max]|nr:hypothetical protein JHK82_027479 [Glycine max]
MVFSLTALNFCAPSFGSSSSTKKRKLSNKANVGSRNKKFKNDDDDEVWKIKKVLEKSNIGTMRRLILRREMEEEFVLPVLGDDADSRDGFLQEVMYSLAIGLKILLQEGI